MTSGPVPPYQPQAPVPGPMMQAPQQYPATSGMAVTSMILGILAITSICCWPLSMVLAVLAVVFGHVGLSAVNGGQPPRTGRGMAVAGLVLGYLVLALAVTLVIWSFASGKGGSFKTFSSLSDPGAKEFRAATKWIDDSTTGQSSGSDTEAKDVAKRFIAALKARDNADLTLAEDELLVWCELHSDRCAFLIFYSGTWLEDEAKKKAFEDRCWLAAQEALQPTSLPDGSQLAVGFRDLISYTSWVEGVHRKAAPDTSSITNYGKGEEDKEGLYRFFDAP